MLSKKQLSNHLKRKRKKLIEIDNKSQKGVIHKKIGKDPTISISNDANLGNLNLEVESLENEQLNRIVEEQNILVENNKNEDVDEARSFYDKGYNNENEHISVFVYEQPNESILLDIYDPRTWNNLSNDLRDELLRNGSKIDVSIENDPKDTSSRHFSSSSSYIRYYSNGEEQDKNYLVYSKELDRVFCFDCKLFGTSCRMNCLTNEGFNDLKYIYERLKEYE
ncbi:unnamed protein product [Lathyrus oleraceus]